MKTMATCPSNCWEADDFRRMVDHNEAQEVRVAAAYDRPICRTVIREQVLGAMLTYAMPAGNA